jgi:hypothetical protein
MDILTTILIIVAVLVLPVILFFGLIGLALFVWSWRRIGPYFVDFGRWIGNWRNYVPCGCLLFGGIVLLVLVAAILPQQFDILRIFLLVVVAIAFSVCSMFAAIIWSIRLGRWLWSRFRQGFWDYLERLWSMVWRGVSSEGRAGAKRPAAGRRAPTKAAAGRPLAGNVVASSPAGVVPSARAMGPRRRSWLDLSWFWALVWGKPQKKRADGSKLVAERPEPQAQTAAAVEPSAPTRVPARPKAGLQPLMWRLGLLGRPRRPGGKPKTGVSKGAAEIPGKPVPPAVPPAIGQPRPTVAGPAAKPVEAKPKPTVVVKPKPRRGIMSAISRVGSRVANALDGVRKGFWLGVFWTGRKARAGVNSILRLLHLGGRRR